MGEKEKQEGEAKGENIRILEQSFNQLKEALNAFELIDEISRTDTALEGESQTALGAIERVAEMGKEYLREFILNLKVVYPVILDVPEVQDVLKITGNH